MVFELWFERKKIFIRTNKAIYSCFFMSDIVISYERIRFDFGKVLEIFSDRFQRFVVKFPHGIILFTVLEIGRKIARVERNLNAVSVFFVFGDGL